MGTIIVILSLLSALGLGSAQRIIQIGGIFSEDDDEGIMAFKAAILRENMHALTYRLEPAIELVDSSNSFEAQQAACSLLSVGVVGIVGPKDEKSCGIVSSICNTFNVPHFRYDWMVEEPEKTKPNHAMTFNMYPNSNSLSRALADLLVDYSWRKFVIIYERDEDLQQLQYVLQLQGTSGLTITVYQLPDDDDYRPMLKEIQEAGNIHLVLQISSEKLLNLFRQAREVNMLEDYQSYIITEMDTHTYDFEEMKYVLSNITTIRLIDTKGYEIRNAVHDWIEMAKRENKHYDVSLEKIHIHPALVNDAIRVLATAIRNYEAVEELASQTLECKDVSTIWDNGTTIKEEIMKSKEMGITGEIVFDENGERTQFQIEIIELSKTGFSKIAVWEPAFGVNYTRPLDDAMSQVIENLQSKTFIVASRIGRPFLSYREKENPDDPDFKGNERFEGYCFDLIDSIAQILNFKYVFELVPDGKYGSYDKESKQWNGLVKHLLDRKADLAICDLTITYERRTAVDFTMPFMTLGISILYSKPSKQPPDLFSFLSPFTLDVWVYTGVAYLVVTTLLYVLCRLQPDEWESPHPCDEDPEEVENVWDIPNSTWLTTGSLLAQGCDLLPKGISTRLICGIWWFFALIMLSSYTANLAAFLTKENMEESISSAEDLAKQSKIKYGAVEGGSTLSFFKGSNYSTYQKMWSVMESARPSVFTKSNDEGVERIKKGKRKYAFFMESTTLQYLTERHCDLFQVGGQLDSKGYGIALPMESPYRTPISTAILKLQETGKLQTLRTKWWKEKHGGGKCQNDEEKEQATGASKLEIANVGGMFLVLGLGSVLGLIVGTIDFLWSIHNKALEEKRSRKEVLIDELKFFVDLSASTKPTSIGQSENSSSRKSSKSSLCSTQKKSSKSDLHSKSFLDLEQFTTSDVMDRLSAKDLDLTR